MGFFKWLSSLGKKKKPEPTMRPIITKPPRTGYAAMYSGGNKVSHQSHYDQQRSLTNDLTNPLNPLSPFFIGNNDDYLPSQNDYPAASSEPDAPNDFGGGNFDGGGAGGDWSSDTGSSSNDSGSSDSGSSDSGSCDSGSSDSSGGGD